MQYIFEKLGYQICLPNEGEDKRTIVLYSINNPDGTIRWIWPAHVKQPLVLKFYNVVGSRAIVFSWAIRIIFFLRLQSLLFKKHILCLCDRKKQNPLLDLWANEWSIFTGTTGPNNKAILYKKNGNNGLFYKVATTENAQKLIDNEYSVMSRISQLNAQSFSIPQFRQISKHILELEDVSIHSSRTTLYNDELCNVGIELYNLTHCTKKLHESEIWRTSIEKLNKLNAKADSRIPNGLLKKLNHLANAIENNEYEFTLAHGDFTPWNLFSRNGKAIIFDWELYHEALPYGFDAFHFIFQQGILVERLPWRSIKNNITKSSTNKLFAHIDAKSISLQNQYLSIYLFINTLNNLSIFSDQQEWHVQTHWMINVWNEALTELLSKEWGGRQLLILDIFDFIHSKQYAALKFIEDTPEKLSEYSDIDICLSKEDANALIKFIHNHPTVLSYTQQSKTFMKSVVVYLSDFATLNLDLIWVFKRKELFMLDAQKVMASASPNAYGIKLPSHQVLAEYIAMFYGLNNTDIPQKYMHYASSIAADNSQLGSIFKNDIFARQQLKVQVKRLDENNGWQGIKHKINYLLDTLTIPMAKGMIITFSGVDGAGKSTVIERIKFEFEKKYRRNVIVIRHRPSVLPILSAWTKGKAQAEQDAASKLPRQGENKSSISSIFRFAYYYFDYFFGQFYIYLKYVLRGYVVLYDRYYFDFINDSKRSNITLPKGLTKGAYALIMNPNFNFFLYADPDTILKRKQELDKDTIVQLTSDYKELFKHLDKANGARFIAIENVILDETIRTIINYTTLQK